MSMPYDRFAPFFPIEGTVGELSVVEPTAPPTDADHQRLTVRLIVFDPGPPRSVSNIKEQQVWVGEDSLYQDAARVDEMLYAWQQVLGEVLSLPSTVLDPLMPADVLHPNVLALKKPRNRDDFAKALRARSRLGSLLARGVPS